MIYSNMFAKVVCILFALICLVASNNVSGRIVNGTDADIKNFPYMVSLRIKYIDMHYCGGAILDKYNILTAAHCAVVAAHYTVIRYGSSNLTGGISADVESITVHENYTANNSKIHDIAIFHLADPLVFDETVEPIHLPEEDNIPTGSEATLTGWGLNETEGSVQDILQKVNIEIYSDEDCEKIHKDTGPVNHEYQICAGVPEGGKGQCTFDSGGPLVIDNVEVGIVSWSVKPCTAKGYPGVFTKVSAHTNWINQHLKV